MRRRHTYVLLECHERNQDSTLTNFLAHSLWHSTLTNFLAHSLWLTQSMTLVIKQQSFTNIFKNHTCQLSNFFALLKFNTDITSDIFLNHSQMISLHNQNFNKICPTCEADCRSVRIFSKYFDTEARTEEWAWVAIPPHRKMTSQSGFWQLPKRVDRCCFNEANKASLKEVTSLTSMG